MKDRDIDTNELLPTKHFKETFHRITVRTKVFNALGDIRKKYRLWDREAAIIWLLQEQGLWEEEDEPDHGLAALQEHEP